MGLVPTLLSLIGMAWGQDVVLLSREDSKDGARFHTELALSLDTVELRAAPPDFTALPMAGQLDQVRPMLANRTGSAVVWLDESDAERLWVSVAFVAADRAVIRMIDLPRSEDAIPQLAMAVRELVSSIYADEPPPKTQPEPAQPEPAPPPVVFWTTGSLGVVQPVDPLAGGTRGVLVGAVERAWPTFGIAGEVHAAMGRNQRRIGPALAARWRWLTGGAQLDWTALNWNTQLQPRLFVGGTHRWDAGTTIGSRLSLALIRDEVVRDGRHLYDSGWVSFSIFFGWGRKISKP